ncbi:MAG: VCBS repeat-containing protein [Gallionella sp.]
MKHLTGLFLLCCCGITQAAPDFDTLPYRYLPLSTSELGKPFPLQWLREVDQNNEATPRKFNVSIGLTGAQLSWANEIDDDHPAQPLTATGKDRAGKPWRVQIDKLEGCAPTQLYQADLDQNGLQDLVVVRQTCGNGLAMPTLIYLLTFENNGRPTLLALNSYFAEARHALTALVDMNHDGKAELIDMRHGQGYWAINLYQVEEARWQRVQGKFAQRSYPLYTRFTSRSNRHAVMPPTESARAITDFDNTTPKLTGILSSLTAARQQDQENELILTLKNAPKQVCTLSEFWTITLDRPAGRTILANLYIPFPSDPALANLANGKLPVTLYGQLMPNECSPIGVWITE